MKVEIKFTADTTEETLGQITDLLRNLGSVLSNNYTAETPVLTQTPSVFAETPTAVVPEATQALSLSEFAIEEDSGPVINHDMRSVDGYSLSSMKLKDLRELAKNYDRPWSRIHRKADLVRALDSVIFGDGKTADCIFDAVNGTPSEDVVMAAAPPVKVEVAEVLSDDDEEDDELSEAFEEEEDEDEDEEDEEEDEDEGMFEDEDEDEDEDEEEDEEEDEDEDEDDFGIDPKKIPQFVTIASRLAPIIVGLAKLHNVTDAPTMILLLKAYEPFSPKIQATLPGINEARIAGMLRMAEIEAAPAPALKGKHRA